MLNVESSLEESITKLTFYHIRCFLLSKDPFTPNLAEFSPVTRARAINLALNQSRIEIAGQQKASKQAETNDVLNRSESLTS